MKKILSLLFALLMVLSVFGFAVFAENEVEETTEITEQRQFFIDLAGKISSASEESLNRKGAEVLSETGVAFYGILLDDPDVTSLKSYAKDFDEKNPEERCVIILENDATNKYYIYSTADMLTGSREQVLESAYNDDTNDTYVDAFEKCLDGMYTLFSPTEYEGEAFELPIPPGTGPDHIPDHRLQPRLVDAAGIIPDDKETEILALLDERTEEDGIEYCIATTPSCGSLSPMEMADDYYDYNGFGIGENRDGVLLFISMDPRYVWISTTGKGMQIIRDSEVDPLIDKFYTELKAGEYDAVCNIFIENLHTQVSSYKGRPYGLFLIVFGISFLISGIIISAQKRSHTSVKSQPSAEGYLVSGSFNLTRREDRFRHRYVTKTAIPKSTGSGGGGGGGGTHVSSSGTTHGGGGRSF